MRYLLILTFSLLGVFATLAQDTTKASISPTTESIKHLDFKNAISTNVVGVFLKRYDLSYERAISKIFSLCAVIETGVYSSGQTTNGTGTVVLNEYKLSGWGFAIEGRVYPGEKRKIAPRGLFTGLYYKQYFLNETYDDHSVRVVDDNYMASGIGLDVGYKLGKKNFMFEPLIGYAANWNNGVGTNKKLDPFYADSEMWTLFIRVEGRLGIVF
jgi:hypothetical protein